MKHFLSATVLLLCMCGSCPAQEIRTTPTGATIDIGNEVLEVEFYTPSVARIIRDKGLQPNTSPKSSVVIAEPSAVEYYIRRNGSVIALTTADLSVSVDCDNNAVTFADSDGRILLQEKPNTSSFTPIDDAGTASFSVAQSFTLKPDEAVFGLGQHRHGLWNQRGSTQVLQQSNMEIAIPFIHSSEGYALYWDNYSITTFTDNEDGMTLSSQVGDAIDYYFIYGRTPDGVIAQWRKLSGDAPMNPLWAFGFNQSRERYTGQDELVDVVRRYRELGVPLDGIIQDWQYWGEDNAGWNAIEFRNPKFYDPKAMMEQVHSLNAHAVISIWPSFGPTTAPYKDLHDAGMLMAHETFPQGFGVKVYDAYSQAGRDIYWHHIDKTMFSIGMDGWWLDATEPEHGPIVESDYDFKTGMGSFRRVRNLFPLVSVGGVYDHQRATSPDKRVFILTRSAFAGQQRYGAHCWSGDIVASWKVLKDQIPAALNFSLCGIPYWNSDIGGFYTNDNFPNSLQNADYRELYTRWMQFAAFTGMMRSHGTNCPREIFQFGNRGDELFDAQEAAIRLRYRLLPYIYSSAWGVTSRGESLMRPLFADFRNDNRTLPIDDQYIFGRSILVSPVVESGARSRKLYLPSGAEWIDFHTGERADGGQYVTSAAPIDRIPLFVRSGSIIPVGPDVQYASEKPWDSMQIRIYAGADAQFTLYEDEGDNYNYENGGYSTIEFNWDDKKGELTIGARNGRFAGMPENRVFRIAVVSPGKATGIDDSASDATVSYDGKETKIKLPRI